MEGKRILLIDDSELIRQMVKMSLEKLGGHQVVTAPSGQEGVEMATLEQPDAILLDSMMPGMDGAATFRELRAREATRHIPIVFLTAQAEGGEIGGILDQQLARVITKPFDFKKLPEQLAGSLGWG